jgi:phenylalanyl-tRNA synthetase beta chain
MLGIKIELKEPKSIPLHFIDGRTAGLAIGETEIGCLGEIHPKILRNWKIKMPVALLEINLEKIFEKI